MNREDIIRMAQECDLIGIHPHLDGIYETSLERFAALVAAAEREACAKVCEQVERNKWETLKNGGRLVGTGAMDCAVAIRKRGKK